MRLKILAIWLPLALAACGGAGDSNTGSAVDPTTPQATPPDQSVRVPRGSMGVALEGEGVRLVDMSSGTARPIAFGTGIDQVEASLAAAFGAPPSERGVNAECGAGPILHVQWPNGFVLLAQDGRFLGWEARASGPTTMDGIGVGSTRAEIEQSRRIEIEQSTLGTEFRSGGLGGLLEGEGAQARVGTLWAGLTCHFR